MGCETVYLLEQSPHLSGPAAHSLAAKCRQHDGANGVNETKHTMYNCYVLCYLKGNFNFHVWLRERKSYLAGVPFNDNISWGDFYVIRFSISVETANDVQYPDLL